MSETGSRDSSGGGIEVTFFVPCYNEAEVIGRTLDKVETISQAIGRSFEIVLIDDASTDNSVRVLQAYRAAKPALPLRVFRRTKNRGLAYNFFEGAFLARGDRYRLIWGGDIVPIESHVALMRLGTEADIVIPDYSGAIGGSLLRRLLSPLFTDLINAVSGLNIGYYNGGALYRTMDVRRWGVEASGFGFQAELITRLVMEGRTYKEIKLQAYRDEISSALRLHNCLSVLHSIVRIAIRRLSRRVRGTWDPGSVVELPKP